MHLRPAVEVAAGEVVCLVGPSGSGKTRTLSALRHGGDGTRPRRLAWTPQAVDDAVPSSARVGAWARSVAGVGGWFRRTDAVALPGPLALPDDVAARRFGSLSTGERQRVLVGLACIGGADGWVADEPTSAQDMAGTVAVVACLRAFAAIGRPVLVASHDPIVHAAADRLVEVGAGRVGAVEGDGGATAAGEPSSSRLRWDRLAVAGRLAPSSGAIGGGLTALTGPSGAGKSTLLRALGGLLPVDQGAVWFDGEPWRPADAGSSGGRRCQVVFAEASRTLRPDRTAGALVGQVARALGVAMPTDAAWRALGLAPDVADLPAARLSGGMAARVALLRALTARPEVLLLDEPTAALDDEATGLVLAALGSPSAPSVVLAATHDPRWVAAASARVNLGA